MSFIKLPFGVFDVVLMVVLTAGLIRGRQRGMSQELLDVIKWLVVVCACGLVYERAGQMFSKTTTVFGLLSCYLIAYLSAGLLVLMLFALVKRGLGGKLLGSDVFGHAEYYLGMGSGVVRFGCMLLAALALLNSRQYTAADVRAMEKFQNDEFCNQLFPTLYTAQSMVFEKSLTGPWIKQNLDFLLIRPTHPENKQFRQREATATL